MNGYSRLGFVLIFVIGMGLGAVISSSYGKTQNKETSLENIQFKPIRFEALLPLEASVGPKGPVVTSKAVELKFRFEVLGESKNERAVATWYAEDIGVAVPPNFKIDSTEMLLDAIPFRGAFTLNRPKNGWPLGLYRLEIKIQERMVHTLRFMIE